MGSDSVIVVGGGWAGLAAAVELADHGVPVTLFESAKQAGGRARGTRFGDTMVDNGQHLLIGAYRETLRLLSRMGRREADLFHRTPLLLHLLRAGAPLEVRAPRWPAPLHLLAALGGARGLAWSERAAALRFAVRMRLAGFRIAEDETVATLLARHGQPPRVVDGLWGPLCLATLNLAPDEASARVFLRVLRDAFARRASDSDLLFPRTDLGSLFPEPAVEFIRAHHGEVHLSTRITGLKASGHSVDAVETAESSHAASRVILAVSPTEAGTLLAPHAGTLAAALRALRHTPIATVYLRYPAEVGLGEPMVGLLAAHTQWVVDRATCGTPGLMAAVISGPGEHMEWERPRLAACVAQELTDRLNWPAPLDTFVVREKRAAFRCGPRIDGERPGPVTPLRNLWLAGDYTATGYPATLEGAVRSGVECARLVLHDLGHSPEPLHETP